MLVGKCTKCGKQYVGWALSSPEYQNCPHCEARLVIRNMSENYQPDKKTFAASQRTGIVELGESCEGSMPQIFL